MDKLIEHIQELLDGYDYSEYDGKTLMMTIKDGSIHLQHLTQESGKLSPITEQRCICHKCQSVDLSCNE